ISWAKTLTVMWGISGKGLAVSRATQLSHLRAYPQSRGAIHMNEALIHDFEIGVSGQLRRL
ncbi:hypothetical protein M1N47_03390, partial [Dehalococcoidia bacterium]|nr:hypothetical protein [Dehalococcoidia bacterium]